MRGKRDSWRKFQVKTVEKVYTLSVNKNGISAVRKNFYLGKK